MKFFQTRITLVSFLYAKHDQKPSRGTWSTNLYAFEICTSKLDYILYNSSSRGDVMGLSRKSALKQALDDINTEGRAIVEAKIQ